MPRTIVRRNGEQVAGPDEIAAVGANIGYIADRLIRAYDDAYDEIRRTGGEAAAAAWHQQHVERWASHASRRRIRRALVGLGVVGLTVGVMYAMATGWF